MAESRRKNQRNEICCSAHPEAPIIEDYSAGDMVCSACGLVLVDRVIDVSSEWRTFSNDDGSSKADPSRVGSAENPLLSQDLSTTIGQSSGRTGAFGETKFSNRSTVNSSDRTLKDVFKSISSIAAKLHGQQSVINKANEIFKEMHDLKKTRGRSHDAFAAACLYLAFRRESVPRSFKEVCSASGISSTEIKRCYTKIKTCIVQPHTGLVDNQDYIPRFCGNMGLPYEITRIASHIATEAKHFTRLNCRVPTSIAATAIYMAVQGTAYQATTDEKKIGEACGVAETTIRDVYREMQTHRARLLPTKS